MAAPQRNAGEGRRQAHSGLCLRGLLPCPWGYGNRSEGLGSKVRQSRNFRLDGRVGGSHHHRIVSAAETRLWSERLNAIQRFHVWTAAARLSRTLDSSEVEFPA